MRSPEIMPPTNARYANQPWADAACSQEYQAQRAAWSASPNSDNSDNAWNVFSFSNRAGKGTHAAVARLQQLMRRLRDGAGAGQAHYLQLDIHNFFNSIDRGGLLAALEQQIKSCRDPQRDVMLFVCQQLLQGEPASQVQWRASPRERAQVPPHKRLANSEPGCGLPIGNLSSQFFANVVLDALDQFAKHQLKCKSYVRYVDDFVLLHEDAAQLEIWQKRIAAFLQEQLGLQLKPEIKRGSCDSGVDFLGYIVHPHYLTVRPRVAQHAHEKLTALRSERLRRNFDPQQLRSTVASYWGHFSHASAHRLRQRLLAQHPWLHTCFKNPHQPHPTFRRQSS